MPVHLENRSHYAGLATRAAIVTGAGRGLGKAITLRLLEHGASVVACDVDASALEALSIEAGDEGFDSPIRIRADLGDDQACEDLITQTISKLGRIDILVNNAAILQRKPLEAVTTADFDRIISVNLRAPFLLSRAAIRDMRARRWGRVINITSIAARTGGSSDAFAYAASKGGLLSLTRALAKEGAHDNVLVNAVLPAGIDTPMLAENYAAETLAMIRGQIPLMRLAPPEEIAELVLWLASDASSYVTGASFDINGGWIMA